MSSDSDELDPDEPRTPMWLPLLGSALFLVALMLFLATGSDDETKPQTEPQDTTEQAADADGAEEGDKGDDQDDEEKAKPRARPRPPRPDPIRAPRPRGGGKMVPSPDSSIRVRRLQ